MLDKCMHALRERPAMCAVAIALMFVAAPLGAQATVRSATPLLSAPNGRELAGLRSGADVRVAAPAATRQGFTQVTLDGFIDAALVGAGRDSFPNAVKAPSGARLRRAGRSDAPIVADLRDGMGLNVISRSGTWIRVRRTAWVASSAIGAAATTAARGGSPTEVTPRGSAPAPQAPARAQEPGAPTPSSASGDSSAAVRQPSGPATPLPGALRPTGTVELRAAPGGDITARIDSSARLVPIARERGWTRVQVEGWIRDEEAVPADTALRLSLSGADLRAAPEKYRGAVVRWDVEFIAVQQADQLRRDLRAGEPYLLARGPGRESGLLYIAVPPALLTEVERLQALEVITVTARIRVGRSEPAGVPVLDLIGVARK